MTAPLPSEPSGTPASSLPQRRQDCLARRRHRRRHSQNCSQPLALSDRPRCLHQPRPLTRCALAAQRALGGHIRHASLSPIPDTSQSSQPNSNSTAQCATPVCSGRDFRHRSLLRRSGNPLSQDTRPTATTFTDYPLPPDTELNTKWHSTPQVLRSPHGCPPSGRALTPPMAYR